MKKWTDMTQKRVRRFFVLLTKTLQTFWVERICILIIYIVCIFSIIRFLDIQIPGFPESRLSAVAMASYGWLGTGPRQPPRDQIWEIQGGQDRENPISANTFWGIVEHD